ncbi:MAG TPA: SirB2 family protein [Thiobacillaceae bacterium]|nr:SirB2 family protein [Thiobacillaceae bacterium]
MLYVVLKQIHLATVVITLSLFVLRGAWMIAASPLLRARWVRVVPHVNDTLLFASGLGLALLLRQYPLVHSWLTAKLVALLVYIALGAVAIKHGPTRRARIAAWIAALLVFGYIVAVARTRSPLPFIG